MWRQTHCVSILKVLSLTLHICSCFQNCTASLLLATSSEMLEKVCKQQLRLWLPPASSCIRVLGLRSYLCSSARNSRWEWSELHNLTFFLAVRIESRDPCTLGELTTTFYKLESLFPLGRRILSLKVNLFFFCFSNKLSLWSPGQPGTPYVDQSGIKLIEIQLPQTPEWWTKGVHHPTWHDG